MVSIHFNPRAPCGARRPGSSLSPAFGYFNPRAPCGARPPGVGPCHPEISISIHAPLAGRDVTFSESGSNWVSFQSTRPLRGATSEADAALIGSSFQSTRPLRGATRSASSQPGRRNFNPRAPCGARRVYPHAGDRAESISIHAPLAGRDRARPYRCRWRPLFQSTRPLRGATSLSALCPPPPGISIHAPLAGRDAGLYQEGAGGAISIHAPLAGRDYFCTGMSWQDRHFNPRAPCGARHHGRPGLSGGEHFNPRAPCGARPYQAADRLTSLIFQSTRPLRGATTAVVPSISVLCYFNPRAPCGARRERLTATLGPAKFQSTRPLRGATWKRTVLSGVY